MAFTPEPGERYTIRKKILTIFGNAFHIYDQQANVIAYCVMKAFRLREKLILYTDETKSETLLSINARSILDFGTTYDVDHASGTRLGAVRRKGFKSFLRDEWLVLDPDEQTIATLKEDSSGLALARRFLPLVAVFSPQRFVLTASDSSPIATYRTHFNLFVYRLGVTVHDDEPIDEMLLLAVGFLLAAIEGRQSDNDA